jgi:hypothetical protein
VVFTLLPGLGTVATQRVKDAVCRLPEQIPGIRAFEVAQDLGLMEGNAQLVAIAEFDNGEAYLAYARNPFHQALVSEVLKPCLASRAAVEYRCM